MKINKTVIYNEKEYTVVAKSIPSATIEINGVSCENVLLFKEKKVYYTYLPEDNSLVIIISNNKPYIFEIPQDTDITDFVKGKVNVKVSKLTRSIVFAFLLLPFSSISYALFKFDENFVGLLLLEAVFLVNIKIQQAFQITPTIKVSIKNMVFLIGNILFGILLYIAMVMVIS